MTTLAQRLQEAIDNRYSYAQVGRACGVSRTSVSRWLSGKVSQIRSQYAFAVADLCNVDPQWLISGQGTKQPGTVKIQTMAPHQVSLFQHYESIPHDLRQAVRVIIEALAVDGSERVKKRAGGGPPP